MNLFLAEVVNRHSDAFILLIREEVEVSTWQIIAQFFALRQELRRDYLFLPLSAGNSQSIPRQIHEVNFNDIDSAEYVMRRVSVGCVLTEPVLQNIDV